MRLPKDLDSHTCKPHSDPVRLWKTRKRVTKKKKMMSKFDNTKFDDDCLPLVDAKGTTLYQSTLI